MEEIKVNPIRDMSPCYKCARDCKKPGCNDTCPDFHAWKAEIDRVNKAREDYANRTFHKRGLREWR